jgi:hypothetical protein
MKPIKGAMLALMLLPAALPAQRRAPKPKPKPVEVEVVSVANEQGLKIGKTTLQRPFGADLVDQLELAGSYGPPSQRIHLVRGDKAGDCPSRFVVVEAMRGREPLVSQPFGTCSPAVSARLIGTRLLVSLPATAAGGTPVRYAYGQGAVRQLDANPEAAAAAEGNRPIYASTSGGCRSVPTTDPALQAEVIATFEDSYPTEYRRNKTLKRATLDAATLRPLLIDMACLAGWAGSDRIADTARPLFASRHGPLAFATLESIAKDPQVAASTQAAARRFAADMSFEVGTASL